jgi:hypothetical protein
LVSRAVASYRRPDQGAEMCVALLTGVVDEFSEGVGNRGKYRFFLTLEDQRRIF